MNRRRTVLVVEDDARMSSVLELTLTGEGYAAQTVTNGEAALREVERHAPDAMLLDLGLPGMDGIDVIRHVRRTHEFPIVVLSASSSEHEQIRALDEGANDYVTKPFRTNELLARIRGLLRRSARLASDCSIVIGDLQVDREAHRAVVGDRAVDLTPIEWKLLRALALRAGEIVTHRQLLSEVWGASCVDKIQYLRVYMKSLRSKLEHDPLHPARIVTRLGVGYQLAGGDAV